MIDVGALFERHHQAVLRYLLRRVDNRQLAEDLAQQVWLKAHRAAPTYEERGVPAFAWLCTIARNVAIDHERERRRVVTVSTERVGEMEAVTSDAGSDGQVDALDLGNLLAGLTEKQRAVIRARFLRGLPIRETSAATGVTEEGVRKLQARALVNLRRMMEAAA